MQFGRFHAFAVLALSVLLFVVQAVLTLEGRSVSATQTAATEKRSEQDGRPAVSQHPIVAYLPGAIGIALAGVGAFLLVQAQRRAITDHGSPGPDGRIYGAQSKARMPR